MSRPRLTVRARLTLLYTGLFAACGAVIVAVSYILMARLPAQGQRPAADARCNRRGVPPDIPASILAQCQAEQTTQESRQAALSQCVSLP